MSRPFAAPLLWALLLATLGVVAVAVFRAPDPETPALFGGGALVLALIAAFIATRRHGPPDAGDRTARVIPDSSVATVWAALSVATLALGAELGLWLVLIGAGMLAVGIGGLVRESRASRELSEVTLASETGADERTVATEGRGRRFEVPGED